jgi:hypothetical protein
MRVNQIAKFRKSAAECTTLAQQTRDPRARIVLATAAVVWEKLAEQHTNRAARSQANRAASSQVGTLLDLLNTVVIADRGSR